MKEEREEPLLGERWHRVAMTERGSLSESIKTADPSQSPCGRQLPPRGAFHYILHNPKLAKIRLLWYTKLEKTKSF